MKKRRKQKLVKRLNGNFKSDFFSEVNTPEKAYWLGYLYNAGNFRKDGFFYFERNSLSDIDSLYRFLQDVDLIADISHRRRNRKEGKVSSMTYYVGFYNKEFTDGFYKYFPKGDSRLDNSQLYPNISPELNRHFIRGLLDSLSSILEVEKDNRLNYVVRLDGNYKMLEKIQLILLDEIGLNSHISTRNTANRFRNILNIQSRVNLPDFIIYLYDDVDNYNSTKHEQLMQLFNLIYPRN